MNDAICSTEWRDIAGLEGKYQVSNRGEVRSLPRPRTPGKVLKAAPSDGRGYLKVSIGGRTRSVHRLVAEAFIPNPSGLPLVRHLDDVPANNVVGNLAWGDSSMNGLDAVRLGGHPKTKKTHCPQGHPYTGENLYQYGRYRRCRECIAAHRYKVGHIDRATCEECGSEMWWSNTRRHRKRYGHTKFTVRALDGDA